MQEGCIDSEPIVSVLFKSACCTVLTQSRYWPPSDNCSTIRYVSSPGLSSTSLASSQEHDGIFTFVADVCCYTRSFFRLHQDADYGTPDGDVNPVIVTLKRSTVAVRNTATTHLGAAWNAGDNRLSRWDDGSDAKVCQ